LGFRVLQRELTPVDTGFGKKLKGHEMEKSKKSDNKIPVISKISRSLRKKYTRYRLKGKDTKEVFTEIFHNNTWLGSDSISGRGSEGEDVKIISQALPELFKQYNISSMLDLPCGDFHWMQNVDIGDVEYTGADLVTELIQTNVNKYQNDEIRFVNLNLLTDKLPKVDLIFCRDCLVHFSISDIYTALENVCRSESKYFLTTTFTERKRNRVISTGQWRPLNLQIAPLNLPEPLAITNEGCTQDGGTFSDKSMALWKISEIQKSLPRSN